MPKPCADLIAAATTEDELTFTGENLAERYPRDAGSPVVCARSSVTPSPFCAWRQTATGPPEPPPGDALWLYARNIWAGMIQKWISLQ